MSSIKVGRRGFLGMLSATPVVGPMLAKKEVERQIADISGLNLSGIAGQSYKSVDDDEYEFISKQSKLSEKAKIARNPFFRGALMDALYEEERYVTRIDLDLATKRSFSLAAKVTYQRQRNVERRFEALHEGRRSYYIVESLIKKALKGIF